MRISQLLPIDAIIVNLSATTKSAVIDELVNALDHAGVLNNKLEYKQSILAREAQITTGIGDGIAIPHAKTAAVKTSALAFGISPSGIDYESLDGEKAHIFFMIAAKANARNEHIETLSRLSRMLMSETFKNNLLQAQSASEVLQLIDLDEQKFLTPPKVIQVKFSEEKPLILAVTACPTGIAHTYMAADALNNKARSMEINLKVETNGSTGIKNQFTATEIKQATAIIVAADKQVEMARFDGKPLIQVPVAKAIKAPQELLTMALNEELQIYDHTEKATATVSTQSSNNGFYKHLMNGVSNMLPFVVGGGILIAISFMFGIKAFEPKDPTFNEFAKLLMDIGGGNAFAIMIPVLAGFIGLSIADRPGFAPAMVGGFIAANNGAGFLGGMIAGFLGGYSIVFLKKLLKPLPRTMDGIKPVLLYPLLGIFITGSIMFLLVVDPVKGLNTMAAEWLNSMGTTNKILLGVILGGMMAVDMGGPINKAAYTFGIAMISAGNYYPQAAIMAGGMVPPLGIAIATTIFKNKFTTQERDAGKTCYIMGASFITEGAIPFAASDPARVIPAAIIGAALAGGLSMLFNISLPAPHGGAFVIPVVSSPLLYVSAILIGSITTAFTLGILKTTIVSTR